MNELLNTIMAQPPAAATALCLALGLAAYILARPLPAAAGAAVLAGSVYVLSVAGGLWGQTGNLGAILPWPVRLGPVSLSFNFATTPLGTLVSGGAAAFTLLIAVYCFRHLAGQSWRGKAYAYMLWTLAGCCMVGWAGNFLILLIGWELVTLMLYLLLNPGPRGAEEGAAKTLGLLGFADQCLLLAVVLMLMVAPPASSGVAGLSNLPLVNLALPAQHHPLDVASLGWVGYTIYALLLVAALAKAGAMPLHSWIPSAAVGSSAPVLALLPGALDKLLGIYLLVRVSLDIFAPDRTFQLILMGVGAVTILAAVFMAMMQHNLKKLLSFHAVSQVGYMVLGIATGTAAGIVGGLLHMVNNALYKSNLFLMSGTVGKAAGSDEIENMGGLARQLPVSFACGLVSAAAISGVPPFNGFVSKWLIYQGCLDLHSGLGVALLVAAVFGSALTVASFVKIMYAAFLSRRPTAQALPQVRARESLLTAVPMIVLALACVALGLYPQPLIEGVLLPVAASVNPAGQLAMENTAMTMSVGATGNWSPSAALGLILIGILVGLAIPAVFALRRVRRVRPFYSGELLSGDDRYRMPGTAFYQSVKTMRGIGPLLEQGARGSMDIYHMAGRYGLSLINLLRAQHTGLICLYVAWCVLGLAVTVIYLMLSGIH